MDEMLYNILDFMINEVDNMTDEEVIDFEHVIRNVIRKALFADRISKINDKDVIMKVITLDYLYPILKEMKSFSDVSECDSELNDIIIKTEEYLKRFNLPVTDEDVENKIDELMVEKHKKL